MWNTSTGDRALDGPERNLIAGAALMVLDNLDCWPETMGEEFSSGYGQFDRLKRKDLAVLWVTRAMLDEQAPPPELHAWNEATIATLLREIRLVCEQFKRMELRDTGPDQDKHCPFLEDLRAYGKGRGWFDDPEMADIDVDVALTCLDENILHDKDWDSPILEKLGPDGGVDHGVDYFDDPPEMNEIVLRAFRDQLEAEDREEGLA